MKYIFDFDDVLFKNTEMLKPGMFDLIARAGVPREDAEKDYYRPEVRWQQFSLKGFITRLFKTYGIAENPSEVYEEIMKETKNFLNTDLLKEIKKIGKENCFIVTNGEKEFNSDKLKYSGIMDYFYPQNVIIVPDDKGAAIQEICEKNANDKVAFIDDKTRFIDELKALHIPNLKTILYTGQNLDYIADY